MQNYAEGKEEYEKLLLLGEDHIDTIEERKLRLFFDGAFIN